MEYKLNLVEKKYDDYVRISSDDILDEIAKKQEKSYSAVFQKNIKLAQRAMLIVLRKAIKDGKNIIWDQTNTTAKMRMEKLGMVPKNYTKKAVWFGVSLKFPKAPSQRVQALSLPGTP